MDKLTAFLARQNELEFELAGLQEKIRPMEEEADAIREKLAAMDEAFQRGRVESFPLS